MQAELYNLVQAIKVLQKTDTNIQKWFAIDGLNNAIEAAEKKLREPLRQTNADKDREDAELWRFILKAGVDTKGHFRLDAYQPSTHAFVASIRTAMQTETT